MNYTLSFWWNQANKEICYAIFDQNYGYVLAPYKIAVTNQADIDQALNALSAQIIPAWNLKVEYKILHNGSPIIQTYGQTYGPGQLSPYLKQQFEARFTSRQSQIRLFLSGTTLTKFTKGLKNLGITGHGDAWKEKLWMIAVHALKSNSEKTLKEVWGIKKVVSTRTKAGRTQFQAWYAAL